MFDQELLTSTHKETLNTRYWHTLGFHMHRHRTMELWPAFKITGENDYERPHPIDTPTT